MNDVGFDHTSFRQKLMAKNENYKRILFTSGRKRSSTIVKGETTDMLYGFGTVKILLNSCTKIFQNGEEVELTQAMKEELFKNVAEANKKSLRTLGIARKVLQKGEGGDNHLDIIKVEVKKGAAPTVPPAEGQAPEEKIHEDIYVVEQTGLTLLGVFGLKDPLRPGVKDAVKTMHAAGITVRMVTGDSKDTATAIAKDCGILPQDDTGYVILEGEKFEERVGGRTLLCKMCEAKKENPDVVINVDLSDERLDKKKEEKEDDEDDKDDKKKKKEDRKILCPTHKCEMEVCCSNLKAFKEIVNMLRVIAVCRPQDKYLLVASLKFLYLSFIIFIEVMLLPLQVMDQMMRQH
jgi:magnesium-transporting ATPase (P-type)